MISHSVLNIFLGTSVYTKMSKTISIIYSHSYYFVVKEAMNGFTTNCAIDFDDMINPNSTLPSWNVEDCFAVIFPRQ